MLYLSLLVLSVLSLSSANICPRVQTKPDFDPYRASL